MYNIAKKYLLLGVSLSLLVVAATFFFNQKETTAPQTEIATKKQTKLTHIKYEGAVAVTEELDNIDDIIIELDAIQTAGTFSLTAMAQSITEEALKAFSDSDGHALPLLSHWNVGIPELTDAMNPMYMIDRIEQGEHILVSWKLDPYYADSIGSSYYEESIKKAAELQLPLVFILPAPESALTEDSYYKNLPTEDNPNVVDQNDNILDKLSPFGPDERWNEVGTQWSSTTLMDNLQIWYPNPPLVIFISEDEADKLSWSELTSSSRFSQQYPTDKDDNFKRILVGAKWIEKYRQLQNGFKEGFTESAWKNNVKFISYNKLSDNFGKSADWIDNATVTSQYINVWPLTADGVTVDFDLTGSKSDATANAPHVLVNNLDFMLKEAKRANSDIAYQLSINDDSKITDATRYRGLTQFSLWFLRPNIIRQKSSAMTRTELEPMFKEVVDSVELIHYNPQVTEFWKNGELVGNGDSYLDENIPEQYQNDPRWFLLDTDKNEPKPWSDTTNINVWTFAIVKGEAPNREWLIYAQSPESDISGVTVSIPNYGDVVVDSKVNGSFYVLSENTTSTETITTEDTNTQEFVVQLGNGTTYYFDATNGNDSNNGTSEETALKTITKFENMRLNPGDNVLFKRGEVWEGVRLINFYYPSGTKEAPILYSSYGDESKPLPVITSIKDQDLTWIKSAEKNIWYTTSLTNNPRRLFRNGDEILNAREMEEISLGQSWYHTYEEDRLYLYSVTDPNHDIFRFSYGTTCYLQDQEYITINNLNLQGGTSLRITGSSNIHILNSKIGLYSSYGLVLNGSTQNPRAQNNIIENNIFDSGFTLDYTWISAGGAGADYIGSNDGVTFYGGVEYSKVYNNYFKNWNHASIAMETTNKYGINNNEIYNNTMTAPDVAYGGRIALSGNAYENSLHHNLLIDTATTNQIRGFNNHFHHNIVDGLRDSPIKDGFGSGLGITGSSGNVYGNLVEYNTFRNCKGAAVSINSYDLDSEHTIYNNTFSHNILGTCEDDNQCTEDTDLKISRGAGAYQIFKNNYISSSTISYEREYISISDFNLLNDNISANVNIMPNDSSIGAGNEAYIGSTLKY